MRGKLRSVGGATSRWGPVSDADDTPAVLVLLLVVTTMGFPLCVLAIRSGLTLGESEGRPGA